MPKSIEALRIQNFQILTRELCICCSDGVFDNFQKILLFGSGESGRFGINATVIEKLVSLPKVSTVYVNGFRYYGPREEIEELRRLPKLYGKNEIIVGYLTEILFRRDVSAGGEWDCLLGSTQDCYIWNNRWFSH